MPAPALLKIATVATLLDVSTGTVRNLWATDPDFPHPRMVGKSPRWLREDIEFYIALVKRRPPVPAKKKDRAGGK